jgi:RNA polymerase sigma factor (sigma-70 family)
MATAQMSTVIRHLRRAVLRQDGAGWTDGQLLASFIDQKDEAAFEVLVRRHGSMVFGVCRRVIDNHHDAEDAFQATLLVLACKASSVRPRERVANWLHGVALRTAMKAKALTTKRRGREKQVMAMPEPEAPQQAQWRDLQPLLDQELNGLPENYRLPILLCDLEGKAIKEAAQQLGWPQGTLAGRLARGRKLLAKRLASRGVVLSAGSLALVVSRNVASAGVPISLVSSTVEAACMIAAGQTTVAGVVPSGVAVLTEGVLKTMFMTKLKRAIAAVLVMAAAIGIGAWSLGYGTAAGQQNEGTNADALVSQPPRPESAEQPTKKATSNRPTANQREDKLDDDLGKLQGTWSLVLHHWKGRDNDLGPATLTIKGDALTIVRKNGEATVKIKLGAGEEPEAPKQIDFLAGDAKTPGIYKLEGTTLLICQGPDGKDRPGEFAARAESDDALFVFRRLTPADGAKEKPVKVGNIFLVGNTKTEQAAILKKIPLGPGDAIDYEVLRTAQKNLAALGARIELIESVDNAEYKDIRVTVVEK